MPSIFIITAEKLKLCCSDNFDLVFDPDSVKGSFFGKNHYFLEFKELR